MNSDHEDSDGVDEPTWEDVMYHEETGPVHQLDARDYIALFIAALQTVFLPIVILAIILVVMGLIFSTMV